jgi:hypothetical protein
MPPFAFLLRAGSNPDLVSIAPPKVRQSAERLSRVVGPQTSPPHTRRGPLFLFLVSKGGVATAARVTWHSIHSGRSVFPEERLIFSLGGFLPRFRMRLA